MNEGNLKPFAQGEDERRNLFGRPKGSRNLSTILKEMLEEEVEVQKGTEKSKEKFANIVIRKLIKKAHEGDIRAIKLIFERMEGMAKQSIEHSGELKGVAVEIINGRTEDQSEPNL